MEVGKIKRALKDSAKQAEEERIGKISNIKIGEANFRKAKRIRAKGENCHLAWGEVIGFEDDEIYGFCSDFERKWPKSELI